MMFNSSGTGAFKACLPVTDNGSKYIATWNEWPTTNTQDYDFMLYTANMTTFLTFSDVPQNPGGFSPFEIFSVEPKGDVCLVLASYISDENHLFHIDLGSNSTFRDSSYMIPSGSVDTPADSPDALSVGAINFNNSPTNYSDDFLEVFSSQGPTDDGTLKPEICGPDGTLTHQTVLTGGGGFFGTSASTPHVAGAAALLLDINSNQTVDQLRQILIDNARFNATFSQDNLCGSNSGVLSLEKIIDTRLKLPFNGNIFDDSIFANQNTVIGTTQFTTGLDGQAFDFNGATHIETADTPFDFDNTNAFSVSTWIKTTNNGESDTIISKGGLSNGDGWTLWRWNTNNFLTLTFVNGGTNFSTSMSGTINDDNWHHVVITYDGSSNKSGLKMYLDGTLDKTGSSLPLATLLNNDNLVIGADKNGGMDFDGQMDNVRVYGFELSSVQVIRLFDTLS